MKSKITLFTLALFSFSLGGALAIWTRPSPVQVKCARLSCTVKENLIIYPGEPIDPSYFDCECLGEYTEPVP